MLTAGRGASSTVGGGRESHPRVLSLTRTVALGQRSGELEAVRESRARSVEVGDGRAGARAAERRAAAGGDRGGRRGARGGLTMARMRGGGGVKEDCSFLA